MDCLFAYTASCNMPPYLNLSRDDEGRLILLVRGEPKDGQYGQAVSIELPREDAAALALALMRR